MPRGSSSRTSDRVVSQGPASGDLLFLQPMHRSSAVFSGAGENHLEVRRADTGLWDMLRNEPGRVYHFLEQMGFGPIFRLGSIKIDHHLITALVERWRPETHTFHLPIGEVAITL